MKRVMLDLETTDKIPGAAIMSIGAVEFDTETGELGREFYAEINLISCYAIGLHSGQETMDWWREQSEEAKELLHVIQQPVSDKVLHIITALLNFNEFLLSFEDKDIQVWGNGANFDNSILGAAYRAASAHSADGIKPAWDFWNDRCYRTLKGIFKDVKVVREGTYHHALHDAKTQAKHAIAIWKEHNLPNN